MKKIVYALLTVAVIVGIGFGIYQIPHVKTSVNHQIAAWKIEKNLEEKYGVEFDVIADALENGDQLDIPKYIFETEDVYYTFFAEFGEETYEVVFGEEQRYYIKGIVDEDMQIIADSYPHILYMPELLDTLEELVQEDFSGEIAAVSHMSMRRVLTPDEYAGSFELFYRNTETYEHLCLFVDEGCTDEELEAAYNTLMEEQFPFSVYIKRIPLSEVIAIEENQVISVDYEEDKVSACIEDNEGLDTYGDWLYEIRHSYDCRYAWYEAIE